MKASTKNNYIYYLIGIIGLFIIWFLIAKIVGEEKLIFPGPFATFKDLFLLLQKGSTYLSILYSLLKTTIGFLIAFVFALIIGTLGGLSNKFNMILKPLITTLKAIPTASVLFLFIVMVGFENSPILVVILITFPILYEAISKGINSVPKAIIEASKLEKGSTLKNLLYIRFPLSFNYFLIGIASSFGLAFKVEIMSEVLSGANKKGIGYAIKIAQISDVTMVPIFSWTIIAIATLFIISIISGTISKKISNNIM